MDRDHMVVSTGVQRGGRLALGLLAYSFERWGGPQTLCRLVTVTEADRRVVHFRIDLLCQFPNNPATLCPATETLGLVFPWRYYDRKRKGAISIFSQIEQWESGGIFV